MRVLYDLFFILFSVGYLPYLLAKGKFHKDFFQKFGFIPKHILDLRSPIWIHAVSVGEANLAIKLSRALKQDFPDIPVIVSTTTETGNDLARKNKEKTIDGVFYYPVDISWIVRRVIKAIKPRLYLIVETEIWPNMIGQMRCQGVPVAVINGRISDSSFKNYKKILFIIKKILGTVDLFCMQSEQDAYRISALGADQKKVAVTGNLKFDEVPVLNHRECFAKEQLGFKEEDRIIVAGSTHYPEERLLIDIFKRLKSKNTDLKLVLAPRHVERNDALKVYCERSGLEYVCFSEVIDGINSSEKRPEILLVDTIGHLKALYEIATVVFIGGSVADKGGQNPIEAAIWAKPIVFGPHMSNFREISNFFLENKAAFQVKNEKDLELKLYDILNDISWQEELSLNARKVVAFNRGAIKKTIGNLEKMIRG